MPRIGFCLVLASAAACAAGPSRLPPPSALAPRTGPVSVPIEIAGRILFVTGTVNGRGPFKFILDTGATETVITPVVAAQLGIRGAPVSQRQSKGRAASVAVGEASVPDLPVYIFDPPQALPLRLDKGINYHGLLGYTFLSRFVTTLDYRQKTLSLVPLSDVPAPRAPTGARADGAFVVPFRVLGQLIHATGSVNGSGPLTFVVDTGSAEVLIEPRVATGLKLPAVVGSREHPGVGFATLRRLSLGDAAASEVPAIVHSLPSEQRAGTGYHGIVGYPFLSQFRVSISYRDRFLLLEPYAVSPRRTASDP